MGVGDWTQHLVNDLQRLGSRATYLPVDECRWQNFTKCNCCGLEIVSHLKDFVKLSLVGSCGNEPFKPKILRFKRSLE